MYLIKKVSEISGVSVRTLHYYDEIGLVSPKKHENGYRYYSENDLQILQTILFYKYLDFPLKQIKEMLKKGDEDCLPHLRNQLILMKQEKERLLTLIDTLEKTIKSKERRTVMADNEKFKGFKYSENEKYQKEAIDRYGKEVIEKSIKRQKGNEEEVTKGFNEIFFAFSHNLSKGVEATAQENVELAKRLHNHICKWSFDCSPEAFWGIGRGYAKNPEFKKNIDRFGEGTAEYISTAISKYVSEKQ